MSFIASRMQTVCPAPIGCPSSTKAGHPAVARGRRFRPSAPRSERCRSRARPVRGWQALPARAALLPWAGSASRSSVRRTETRIPASSIVTSPIPVSWTIRTTSRIRSARAWSTPPLASRLVAARSSADGAQAAARRPRRRDRAAAAPPRLRQALPPGPGLRAAAAPSCPRPSRDRPSDRWHVESTPRSARAECRGGPRPASAARRPPTGITSSRQHVQQRLRAEHLADRRREWRPTNLRADQDPAPRSSRRALPPARLRTQAGIECGDETGRQIVLRSAHRNARRERRHRLVADVLVDDVGRIPRAP